MAYQVDEVAADPRLPAAGGLPMLLGIAWRRKWLIVVGVLVGLIAGSLHWAQRTPVYRASTQILVIKKRPNALPITGPEVGAPEYYEDYLTTHMVLLRSPLILDRAARKPALQALPRLAQQPGPLAALQAGLAVSRDLPRELTGGSGLSGSTILTLNYSGPTADECPLMLDAVVEAYKEFLDETYQTVSADAVKLIKEAREILEKDIANKAAEYRAFREQLPVLWKGKDGVNLNQETLGGAQSKLAALQLRQAELQGQLDTVAAARKAGRSREELLALVLAHPDNAKAATRLEDTLVPLLLRENQLEQQFGPEHAELKALRRQIRFSRELLGRVAALRSLPAEQTLPPAGAREADPVERYDQSLRRELEAIRATEQALADLVKRTHDAARKLANHDLQDEMFRSDLQRSQQLYDSIIRRLQEVNLAKDLGGYDARTISPPHRGNDASTPLASVLRTALVLGLLGGVALAYLVDIADRRFRSPEEIRSQLGVDVVWHIPLLRNPAAAALQKLSCRSSRLDPSLCSYHLPKSSDSEAYRVVRTALYFSTRGEAHKVIQVTSPFTGDGKTTLAANLAVCIAQSGKKVLLIDADLRRPRLHSLFGTDQSAGLPALIEGRAEPAEVIRDSGVPGLDLLPSGPVPPNPAELLTAPRFEQLLEQLRARYDIVLLDSPPLLLVTDPCVIAPRTDGVLLTFRISKNSRAQIERAKEMLDALGASVLGVVVNAVDRKDSYYGHYRYGQYGYGQYGYTARPADAAGERDGSRPPQAALDRGGDAPKQG